MLERIEALPAGMMGLRAKGKVSKEDYEKVVVPSLDEARREGRRVRFLYHFGPEFEGFTAAAAWEDMRIGLQRLRLFERCAVVTDVGWIRTTARALGAAMPCPLKVFENSKWDEAVAWLGAPLETSLQHHIVEDRGVLVIEPKGRLRAQDFDVLEASVDAWIERSGGRLKGLVVHAREFPGWEDLGSALRHLAFVRDQQRQIPRVAWAVDSKLAALGPVLAQQFVRADIKRFSADALEDAIAWAGGDQPGKQKPASPAESTYAH